MEEGELSPIIYIGHLPEDFEEKQMKKFFSEFGKVVNLQLSRSKKTGNSKHYGFIEFETPEIATIVAKAMNNYPLYNSILVCSVLPKSKVHPMLFKNARRGPKKEQKDKQPLAKKDLALTLAKKEKVIMAKLSALGIDYTWPSLVAQFEAHGVTIPDREVEIPKEEE